MSLSETIEDIRSALSNLDWELRKLDLTKAVDYPPPEDVSEVILMAARILPRVIDHAEGHSPLTAHDVRSIRDTWAWLEVIRQKYGIKEPLPGKEANHAK